MGIENPSPCKVDFDLPPTVDHSLRHIRSAPKASLCSEVNKELSFWQNRACQSPGTIHAIHLSPHALF
jgi:hypothetical protein